MHEPRKTTQIAISKTSNPPSSSSQQLPNLIPPMDIQILLVFLALASPVLSQPSSFADKNPPAAAAAFNSTFGLGEAAAAAASSETCNGLVGECISAAEEQMMMGDEAVVGRVLAQRARFISYDALKKNNVPCNRRGNSYYNCVKSGKANPYRRGCSAITHCQRYTD